MDALDTLFHICFAYIAIFGLLHFTGHKMFKLLPRLDEMKWHNVMISILFIIAVFIAFTLIVAHEMISLFKFVYK